MSSCSEIAIHILSKEVEKGSNFVFSPLSFQFTLSLIAVGSKGSTLQQLLSFLGSTSTEELSYVALQIANSVLLPANECPDITMGPIMSFLNGAWVDQRFGLKPSFEEVLKTVYHATAKDVDFANKADQVIDEVNSWVESATKGLIKTLLPQECLDSNTSLVLANALYFKGAWDRKFDESRTQQKDFYQLDGQTVHVPFMTSKPYEKHLYGSFNSYKILRLPYQNGQDNRNFSMYFFLPNAKDGIHHLIQEFKSNPEFYNTQFDLQEEELYEFWIPRFKFAYKLEASNTLKELGLTLPFRKTGEFTEMVNFPESVELSKIYHESCVEVNEHGTEAAASTAPQFRLCCGRMDPPKFVADHPFMFVIKEERSSVVFFIGAVLNPLLVS
ncbi:serpin-ZX-like [Mercurialis annua]|uniref:serpin-ZX-like n=1 Tax=Mercurialis annua TaxID=3986 RepID=UPI00215DFEFD|nr:serpin-ZX-like [Mercurialis annua]